MSTSNVTNVITSIAESNSLPVTKTISSIDTLAENNEYKYQGEANIGISPFDDYFLFNIVTEINGENVPMDLTNVGTLYLSFISDKDEIRIANLTNITGIDSKQGQVIFKITKENGKRILGFNTNSFYISTKKVSSNGESNESVLYTGKFYSFDKVPEVSLRTAYQENLDTYILQVKSLSEQVSSLTAENITLKNDTTVLGGVIDMLNKNIFSLNSLIDELNSKLTTVQKLSVQDKINALNAQKTAAINAANQVIDLNSNNMNTMSIAELEKLASASNMRTLPTTKQ